MGIKVVNGTGIKKKAGVVRIYVGRQSSMERIRKVVGDDLIDGSVLGNRFVMKTEADREKVIEEYRKWLWEQVKARGEVWSELMKIGDLVRAGGEIELVCWCAPKACHGDVIRRCVLWMMQ